MVDKTKIREAPSNFNKFSQLPLEMAGVDTCTKGIKTLRTRAPIFAQYEITSRCNQKCFFCYNVWKGSNSREKDLNADQKSAVMEKLIDLEIFGLIISGGEPLLVDNLDNIIQLSADAGIETTIITNATLLTLSRSKTLKEAGLEGMQISMHSHIKSLHENVTGIDGSFDLTLAGIDGALKCFNDDQINVNMVATRKSFDKVFDMASFMKSRGVVNFTVSSFDYSGLGNSSSDQAPDRTAFCVLFEQLLSAKKELNMSTFISGAFPLCVLNREIDQEVIGMVGNICDAGITQIVVSPSGFVRPCVSYSEKICHIFDYDIRDKWKNHPFLKSLRNLENIPTECSRCDYLVYCCGGCRASGREHYGQFNSLHPLLGEANG